MFVGHLVLPGSKNYISWVLILYTSIFMILQQSYTLVDSQWIDENRKLLAILGFPAESETGKEWKLFSVHFYLTNWLVLFAAHFNNQIVLTLSKKQEIQKAYENAKSNLKQRHPKLNLIFLRFYYLKRNIFLTAMFLTFYLTILFSEISLVYWGFIIITTMLVYVEISMNYTNQLTKKRKYYFLMIFYSAFLMLTNITVIFLSLPYLNDKDFVQTLRGLVPYWILEQPRILGLIHHRTDDNRQNLFKQFIPYLIFFLLTIYVYNKLSVW